MDLATCTTQLRIRPAKFGILWKTRRSRPIGKEIPGQSCKKTKVEALPVDVSRGVCVAPRAFKSRTAALCLAFSSVGFRDRQRYLPEKRDGWFVGIYMTFRTADSLGH